MTPGGRLCFDLIKDEDDGDGDPIKDDDDDNAT